MGDMKAGLYLLSARGLAVLEALLKEFGPAVIAYVVTASDSAVENDFRNDIEELATRSGIPVFDRISCPMQMPATRVRFAAGWRWLLREDSREPLVVFHDSLLPRYRGFAPLVSALINGDNEIGVTALLASSEYDTGPILSQVRLSISYPLRISQAIDAVRPLYGKEAVLVFRELQQASWSPIPQDTSRVTYSLWRDEKDYMIDWTLDATMLRRFVDATGDPYRGASTFANGQKVRVTMATEMPEVSIENRTPGKIIFLDNGRPVVVCGTGLLRIDRMVSDGTKTDLLPWTRFRTRFCAEPKTVA